MKQKRKWDLRSYVYIAWIIVLFFSCSEICQIQSTEVLRCQMCTPRMNTLIRMCWEVKWEYMFYLNSNRFRSVISVDEITVLFIRLSFYISWKIMYYTYTTNNYKNEGFISNGGNIERGVIHCLKHKKI